MGFKSVPFLFFFPAAPLPLVADAATLLAICLPLFNTLVRSTPSMFGGGGGGVRGSEQSVAAQQ